MRCADDICSVLGWTKVSAVIRRAADNFNDKATNPRGRAFAAAMKARTSYPPLIHNPWVPIWGNGPLADVYRGELTPVFWVFADSWAPSSREMAAIDSFLYDTLYTQWTRAMMLGHPAPLRVPVRYPRRRGRSRPGPGRPFLR